MNRLKKLKSFMEQEKLEAIFIADQYNMYYYTGYSGDTGIYYHGKSIRAILTDGRYITQANEETDGTIEIIDVGANRGYYRLLAELAKKDGVKQLGFQDDLMTVATHRTAVEAFADVELVPIKGQLDYLRTIKDEGEINKIRQAQKITDAAFGYLLENIRVGMTELEVAAMLEFFMKTNGAQNISFDTIAVSGLNGSRPHGVPGNKRLETGDFVTTDFGCLFDRYCSDMTRTFVIGEASDRQKDIYYTVLAAQKKGIETARAGLTGKEVDKAARSIIEQKGYGDYFVHSLGHSVGLYIHESPNFSKLEERVMQPGMIMTVEPGIYIPDFGGVRIEDMILITENGCEDLTGAPKDTLIEIR
ncbi:MAG: aminopeptidase P family protein [Lachnospiraceae bacterium]|nr:aminopeptidase P family protein [Lachnospiraceae bacterium]MDY5742623.1 aminopeptidase P family protein [Lachnospiraceae bacterium]